MTMYIQLPLFPSGRSCIIRLYDRICYTRINIYVMNALRENIYFNISGHFDIAKLTVLELNGGINTFFIHIRLILRDTKEILFTNT